MKTQGVQFLLLLLCVVSTCWGQQVYLTLGSGPSITTNNTEIFITTIGEGAQGGLPSLTCHSDLTTCCRSGADNFGNGILGQWTHPDGSEVVGNVAALNTGQQFYIVRDARQVIVLNRRVSPNNPLTPTGSYCCTVPTTGGDMTLCANLVVSLTCMSLPPPTNGGISYSNMTLGENTVATYTCDTGYTLNGGSTRTCESDGMWSGLAPVCQGTCSDLPPIFNGGITYTDGPAGSRPVDSVSTYTCDNGYTVTGGSFRVCQNDGTWSGTAPICQSTCPDLTVPTNGVIIYSSSTAPHRPRGTVVTQSCLNGYVPSTTSTATRVCRAERLWSGSALTCQLPPVYVSVGTTNYAVMNSQVAIDTIGDTTETALTCRTDSTICCTGQDNPNSANGLGYWLLPNGTVVTRKLDITDSDTDLLYSVGDTDALRLHRRGSVSGPTGSYCCVIPDSTGVIQAFCVQLASTDESSLCQCDNTGAVVGGVVVTLVVVAVIAVTVVMVTYLVLRYKRGGKMTVPQDNPLPDQGQSATATYKTEDIPASSVV
ncbi:complement receptor type 1-like isoform X2 [Halichondria panicea]|uniref:complement receptor type 1-like isoform X2 n=1 Tax=Halichondria panicea TaxID=6063 RepID=UPI00312B2BC1